MIEKKKVSKNRKRGDSALRWICNAPKCSNSTEVNDAVWWTPHGSTCSQECALALIESRKVKS